MPPATNSRFPPRHRSTGKLLPQGPRKVIDWPGWRPCNAVVTRPARAGPSAKCRRNVLVPGVLSRTSAIRMIVG